MEDVLQALLCPNMFSLAGIGFQKTRSTPSHHFDIENLPKLHRSDELRNGYLKRSMKGIYQPLDGGPAEIVVGTSKLHFSFRDPTTFFLAWQIYVSIRAEFKPEMGTRLAYWTE